MKTILLVEENPLILDIYSAQLKKEGYKIDVANNGQLAIEKIRNNYPDLVILDIDLPKMNGCEVLKILRQDERTKDVKIIVLSNFNEQDVFEKYNIDISNLGVIKYLLKVKTTPEEIANDVREILK